MTAMEKLQSTLGALGLKAVEARLAVSILLCKAALGSLFLSVVRLPALLLFPSEPPFAIVLWPERRAAGKGASAA